METITELKVGCPHCGYSKWVDARHSGAKARCPNCDGEFRVPRAPRSKRPPTSQPPTSRAPSSLAPASAANSDEAFEKTERAANARTPLRLSGAGRTPRKASHSAPAEDSVRENLPEADDPLLEELERSDAGSRAGGGSREELIDYEGHVRAIALWNRLPGLLAVLMAIVFKFHLLLPFGVTMMVGGIKLSRMKNAGRVTIMSLSVFQGLFCGLMLVQLVSQIDLSVPAILQTVAGMAYYAFQFKYLFDARAKQICTEAYQQQIEADGYPAPYLHSPFFIVPAILFSFTVLGLIMTAIRLS